jgi:hypothetical protein
MPERVHRSFTDGQAYVEEIYKLLRGEGYSPAEILELFKLKRELQLAVKAASANGQSSNEIERILSYLQVVVR